MGRSGLSRRLGHWWDRVMGPHRTASAPHLHSPTARELRAARARIRARLDTVPRGSAPDDPDDGPSPSPPGWRMVWAALAALPLAAAILIGVLAPPPGPEPTPAATSSATAETADPAAAWRAPAAPLTTSGPEALVAADGAAVPREGSDQAVAAAPAGHRAVAVRPVDPAAAELVREQDEVDVVGLDGTVIAAEAQVLQVRPGSSGTVLVVAVPDQDAARVAAAVVSVEATVVVNRQSSPSAGDAAPTATDPVR